jgi:apolipoprotein D and lipocalin family protein
MRMILRSGLALAALLAVSACAGQPVAPMGPQPVHSVDAARLFTGRWYEIARTPMRITDGCVAGTTDYLHGPGGNIIEFDACRKDTPEGAQESIQGPMTILNPPENTETLVHYHVFHGLITITRRYWIYDHGADYDWFIFGDPDFKNISVFTRNPRPDQAEVEALTARAKALGYDTSKLEYPATFPPGAG